LAKKVEGRETKQQRIRRGAARTLTNLLLFLVAAGVSLAWLGTGFYKLELGEEAIILRLGKNVRTESREGWNWHWPVPLEEDVRINTQGQRTEVFGIRRQDAEEADSEGILIQTADQNVVSVSFELQYTVGNPYSFRFGMLKAGKILYESTQSAIRQAIGGMTVDEVLIKRKHEVEILGQQLLDGILEIYFPGSTDQLPFMLDKINLQEVNPPASVRGAFNEVAAAQQDEERYANQARGEAAEILERAAAEAAEIREGSQAYREAKILNSKGESERFEALVVEYRLAPQVTRRRLYLETMEVILPAIDKVIVEEDAAQIIPLIPISSLQGGGGGRRSVPQEAPRE
jgi:membrane protease subunit HflK